MNLPNSHSFLVLLQNAVAEKEFPSGPFRISLQLQIHDLIVLKFKCNDFEKILSSLILSPSSRANNKNSSLVSEDTGLPH